MGATFADCDDDARAAIAIRPSRRSAIRFERVRSSWLASLGIWLNAAIVSRTPDRCTVTVSGLADLRLATDPPPSRPSRCSAARWAAPTARPHVPVPARSPPPSATPRAPRPPTPRPGSRSPPPATRTDSSATRPGRPLRLSGAVKVQIHRPDEVLQRPVEPALAARRQVRDLVQVAHPQVLGQLLQAAALPGPLPHHDVPRRRDQLVRLAAIGDYLEREHALPFTDPLICNAY
ncbi:hypothetical protein Ae356Ps1_6248 [Pseudonocardia sp. Ae356_Ps1]|nr:hypothetical protein Ae356Ps1_6248 [Pseudonocardia sp. Ae356_Ps1]